MARLRPSPLTRVTARSSVGHGTARKLGRAHAALFHDPRSRLYGGARTIAGWLRSNADTAVQPVSGPRRRYELRPADLHHAIGVDRCSGGSDPRPVRLDRGHADRRPKRFPFLDFKRPAVSYK